MTSPKLNLGLQTKLSQKIVITPQMRQSLEILQMPITELTQEIYSYVVENPLLEIVDNYDEFSYEQSNIETSSESLKEESDDFSSLISNLQSPEWDNYIDSESSFDIDDLVFNPEDKDSNFENYLSANLNLYDLLLFQLNTSFLSEKEKIIGTEIIGNLTEDGYFRNDLSELACKYNVTLEQCDSVLKVIQKFEPTGVASRNLQECILSQLPDLGATQEDVSQISELLTFYEKDLENYRYCEIEKKVGIKKDRLDFLLSLIKKTDPSPGRRYLSGNIPIVPDIYVDKSSDCNYEVRLNEKSLPPLRISSYYRKILKSMQSDQETKTYLEDKLKNAIWIIRSLQRRKEAIYLVTKAIVDIQGDYLNKGDKYLKPLKLKDIADITGLSESTVSRVTNGKYVMTCHGIMELKSFFSKGIISELGDMSTRAVKNLMKTIIERETFDCSYSDEKLVSLLRSEGIDIARRTVAKYREELGIPTMSQRKRMRR